MTTKLPDPQHTGELDLDAIEARAKAATEGPWVSKHDGCTVYGDGGPLRGERSIIATSQRDATFIAHARTDIPALCAALRAERTKYLGHMEIVMRERDEARATLEQKSLELEAIRDDEERKVTEINQLRAVARAAEAVEKSGLWDKDSNEYAYGVDAIRFLELADALAALRSHRTSTEVDASRDSGEGNGQ